MRITHLRGELKGVVLNDIFAGSSSKSGSGGSSGTMSTLSEATVLEEMKKEMKALSGQTRKLASQIQSGKGSTGRGRGGRAPKRWNQWEREAEVEAEKEEGEPERFPSSIKRNNKGDVVVGCLGQFVDTTSRPGWIRIGKPDVNPMMDIAVLRRILKEKCGLSAKEAEAKCLPTLCNRRKDTGAATCTTPEKPGHESHDSEHHVQVEGFLEELQSVYPSRFTPGASWKGGKGRGKGGKKKAKK